MGAILKGDPETDGSEYRIPASGNESRYFADRSCRQPRLFRHTHNLVRIFGKCSIYPLSTLFFYSNTHDGINSKCCTYNHFSWTPLSRLRGTVSE